MERTMVISCPACSKKFRFNGEVKNRARFRCTGCNGVFSPQGTDEARGGPAMKGAFKVLAATGNNAISDAVRATLGDERVSVSFAATGDEAVEMISKDKPHLLVIDAAIQGLFSFTICERIRNAPRLKDMKIILASAAFNKGRYKRRPSELFGADRYIEAHLLEGELASVAGELLGVELRAAPVHCGAGRSPVDAGEQKTDAGQAPAARGEDQKAKRLARVIAADILLYNRKKLGRRIQKADALALFGPEIAEAVKYFTKRLPEADTSYIHAAIEECIDSMNKAPAEAAVC